MSEALESALVVLSGITLIILFLSWAWVHRLSHRVEGDGQELIAMVSFFLGWTVLLRIMSYASLTYFAITGETDLVIAISVLTQVLFLALIWAVWRRLRRFRNGA